jgi:hypothetical protein
MGDSFAGYGIDQGSGHVFLTDKIMETLGTPTPV